MLKGIAGLFAVAGMAAAGWAFGGADAAAPASAKAGCCAPGAGCCYPGSPCCGEGCCAPGVACCDAGASCCAR